MRINASKGDKEEAWEKRTMFLLQKYGFQMNLDTIAKFASTGLRGSFVSPALSVLAGKRDQRVHHIVNAFPLCEVERS